MLAVIVNQMLQIILLAFNRMNFLGQNCQSDEVLGHSYFPKAVFAPVFNNSISLFLNDSLLVFLKKYTYSGVTDMYVKCSH